MLPVQGFLFLQTGLHKLHHTYRSAADYPMMLRFYESGKVIFTPIYQVLSNFGLGGMSSTQVGVRENATIRYERGYMSKKKYHFVMMKSRIYELIHRG